jgi:mono/diheme cytochrome c family protein
MTSRSIVRRIVFAAIALVILVLAALFALETWHEPGSDIQSAPVADVQQQVARGEYLAKAGNCMACHTSRGGEKYAGGRAIATPFGQIYSSNITPDRDTGIGVWTSNDFWRALHNGKSRDGSFLYPAFPYPNYTKVTRADSDAIYAHLRTVAPVRQDNLQHELRFPYNQRALLAFWRVLYFEPGVFEPQAAQSAAWNRGAYLVEGLGHCSACHTERNALGGTVGNANLAGGMIPMLNWYASSLTSDAQSGLGDWHTRDIADLLKTGVSSRGAVFGPMSEVVAGSLQHLSDDDIEAMAVYLKSVPHAKAAEKHAGVQVSGNAKPILEKGARLYEKHCAACHGVDGKGAPPAYPPLAGARSLTTRSSINSIRIVLNGGYPPSTAGNPRPYGMPAFRMLLNEEEVAAVVSYARSAWGNQGGLVSPVDVARFGAPPAD